jgi:hypothetical protein
MHGEYRARLEGVGCNALLCHRCGTRHLDAPINHLPVFVLLKLAIRPDQIEVQLSMIGLSNELVGYAG